MHLAHLGQTLYFFARIKVTDMNKVSLSVAFRQMDQLLLITKSAVFKSHFAHAKFLKNGSF